MIQIKFYGKNNSLGDCGYSPEEQAEIYERQLQEVIDNPGEYLDNLRYLRTYRVCWKDYRSNTATIPARFVKKQTLINKPHPDN